MSETTKTSIAENAAVEKEEPKAQRVPKAPKKKKPVMYVGPTIHGVGIQNCVYSDIPKSAEAAFKEVPELKNLFIPVKMYPQAELMLRTHKGYIASAFNSAMAYKAARKGGK